VGQLATTIHSLDEFVQQADRISPRRARAHVLLLQLLPQEFDAEGEDSGNTGGDHDNRGDRAGHALRGG